MPKIDEYRSKSHLNALLACWCSRLTNKNKNKNLKKKITLQGQIYILFIYFFKIIYLEGKLDGIVRIIQVVQI